jgi:hypothetical protein
MPLVTAAQVKAVFPTDLADDALQGIIDREEAALVARYGAHTGSLTEVIEPINGALFTKRPIASVATIDGEAVADTVTVWNGTGRLTTWGCWNRLTPTTIVYTPVDDSAERAAVIIELVRITLNRTTMKSESVAGEYSYTAPDNWEAERAKQYRRLRFADI